MIDPQSLLLLAIAPVILTAAWVLARGPVVRSTSLSEHVGKGRTTYLVFALASTLSIAALAIFMWGWFAPTYRVTWLFEVIFACGMLGELAAAWVPYVRDNPKGKVHNRFAYGMALCMLVLALFLPFVPALSLGARWITVLIAAWMMFSVLLFLSANQHARRHYLVYQVIYILCFYAILVVATFVR